jgi:hypothetical protein
MADLKEIKQGVRRSVEATDREIERFIERLKSLYADKLDEILGGVMADDPTAIDVAYALGKLKQTLIQGGLGDRLAEINVIYGRELRQIAQELKASSGAEIALTDSDLTVVQNLITFDTAQISGQLDTYSNELSSSIVRSVIGGEAPNVAEIQRKIGDRAFASIQTDLTTSMMGFNRTVTKAKAEEAGLNLFIYMGPDDKVTRPFCHELLQKKPAIYTSEEIDGMDNDQGLSVSVYGGGYNCRHQWRALTEQKARSLGWTGE